MPNYIRACFCVDHPITADHFFRVLQALDHSNCRYNIWIPGVISGYLLESDEDVGFTESALAEQTDVGKLRQSAAWLAASGDTRITFGWNVQGQIYEARLFRDAHDARIRVVFDVDEDAFPLAYATWKPYPVDTALFAGFMQILIQIIREIQPMVGVIGYEADLLCDAFDGLGLSWGNYMRQSTLRQWDRTDIQTLQGLVDEYVPIDDLGVLIFMHPTDPQHVWIERIQHVEALLQRNPIMT